MKQFVIFLIPEYNAAEQTAFDVVFAYFPFSQDALNGYNAYSDKKSHFTCDPTLAMACRPATSQECWWLGYNMTSIGYDLHKINQ